VLSDGLFEGDTWILAARVLKNSEEVEEYELKALGFQQILKHSLLFMALYQYMLDNMLNQEKPIINETEVSKDQLEFLSKFLLFVHQDILFSNIGTAKLAPIIKKFLDDELRENNVSEVEKFTALFLYSDLKVPDSMKYLNDAIPSRMSNVVKDFSFLKLTQYSAISKDPNELRDYKTQMGKILNKTNEKTDIIQKQKRFGRFNHKNDKKLLFKKIKEKEENNR
jgi:hypothetical protein